MSAEDRASIEQVIERAYIEGIHLEQDADKVHGGFHPAFRMLVANGTEITPVDPDTFLQKVTERRASDPAAFEQELRYELPLIDIEGTAAVARIELYRGDVRLFTDYQLLYKLDGAWKIVSKIYHAHR